jgi:hypothetical protein
VLFILPLLGFGRLRRFGHVVGVVAMVALLGGVVALTCLAIRADAVDPLVRCVFRVLPAFVVPAVAGFFLLYLAVLALLPRNGFRKAVYWLGLLLLVVALGGSGYVGQAALADRLPGPVQDYVAEHLMEPADRTVPQDARTLHEEQEAAEAKGGRAVRLAAQGIPAEGPITLLRNDPKTQFPRVFLRNCASCHSYGEFGPAEFRTTRQKNFEKAKFSASDLAGFGKEEWIFQFLQKPGAERFLGRSKKGGRPRFTRMANWVDDQREKYRTDQLTADFRQLASWLATHPTAAPAKGSPHAPAYQLFTRKYKCTNCHAFPGSSGKVNTPSLAGYGSADWLRKMVRAPGLPHTYGKNNVMPAFRDFEGVTGALEREEYAELLKTDVKHIRFANLSDIDREILVRHLTGDDRVVFGGRPITAAGKE